MNAKKEPLPIPKGYQQLTGLSTVKSVTVPAGANQAIIRAEGTTVRWRDDGVAPTAAVGYPLEIGEELVYDSPAGIANLKFIETAASATVDITYYGA